MGKRLLAGAGLTGFIGHNLRDTFATFVERKAGDYGDVRLLVAAE